MNINLTDLLWVLLGIAIVSAPFTSRFVLNDAMRRRKTQVFFQNTWLVALASPLLSSLLWLVYESRNAPFVDHFNKAVGLYYALTWVVIFYVSHLLVYTGLNTAKVNFFQKLFSGALMALVNFALFALMVMMLFLLLSLYDYIFYAH